MKYYYFVIISALACTFFCTCASFHTNNHSLSDQNKISSQFDQIDSLLNIAQPQKAAVLINELYNSLPKEGNPEILTQLLVYKLKAEANYQEDYKEKHIRFLESEIPELPFPANAIMQSIVAEIYQNYYMNRQYQLSDQTPFSKVPETMSEWPASVFLDTIKHHYLQSVNRLRKLNTYPLNKYLASLTIKTQGEYIFQESFADLLGQRAIIFFKSYNYLSTQPNQLSPHQITNAFMTSWKEFIEARIDTSNQRINPELFTIYQQLENLHFNNKNYDQLISYDLDRLNYVFRLNPSSENEMNYLLILKKFKNNCFTDNSCLMILHERTGLKMRKNTNPNTIHQHLVAGMKEHEDTTAYGYKLCLQQKQQLEKPHLNIQNEQHIIPGQPTPLLVSYKNLTDLKLFIYKPSRDQLATIQDSLEQVNYHNRNKFITSLIKTLRPFYEQTLPIPKINNYQAHTVEYIMPELNEGNYFILCQGSSHANTDSLYSFSSLYSTHISYMTNFDQNKNLEIWVQNRKTGEPLVGADVVLHKFSRHSRNNNASTQRLKTDNSGKAVVENTGLRQNGNIQINWQEESLSSCDLLFPDCRSFYLYPNPENKLPVTQCKFYTDRDIYRPGQTVHFKGIVYKEIDQTQFKASANQQMMVILTDANHQNIDTLELVSNEYGSISGQFKIPRNLLTGRWKIKTTEGQITFRVEEYKRPGFKVELKQPVRSFALNDTVILSGYAETYSGIPLANVSGKLHVTRYESFLYRDFGSTGPMSPPHRSHATTIHSKTFETNEKGQFTIRYHATAPQTVTDYKLYVFNTKAEITDINGETQSDELRMSMSKTPYLIEFPKRKTYTTKNLKIPVSIKDLSGNAVKETIRVQIFRIPESPLHIERYWNFPDTIPYLENEFGEKLPYYSFSGSEAVHDQQELILEKKFTINKKGFIDLSPALNNYSGSCMIKVSDLNSGMPLYENNIILYDNSKKEIPVNKVLWTHTENKTLQPGQAADLYLGSAIPGQTIRMMTEGNHNQSFKSYTFDHEQVIKISLPIHTTHEGGFFVHFFTTFENRFFQKTVHINVPYQSKQLDVKLESFRNKSQPGAREQIKIKLPRDDDKEFNTELMAVMYDASLDKISKLRWDTSFYQMYTQRINFNVSNSFTSARSGNYHPSNAFSQGIIRPRIAKYQLDLQSYFNTHHQTFHTLKTGSIGESEQKAPPPPPPPDTKQSKVSSEVFSIVEYDMEETEMNVEPTFSMDEVSLRNDFSETAFFKPHLTPDKKGAFQFLYNMPESLTEWKFLCLVHNTNLHYGTISEKVITQKEVMVEINAPRFLRTNDSVFIPVKITNHSMLNMDITFRFSASNLDSDSRIINQIEKSISIQAGESTVEYIAFKIPGNLNKITFKTSATGENHQDGEQITVPVLTNYTDLIRAFPFLIRPGESDTLNPRKHINIKDTSQLLISWSDHPLKEVLHAVPYMKNATHEGNEQIFTRLFASLTGRNIIEKHPEIRAYIENLDTIEIKSPLMQAQELKNEVIEKTPWLTVAKEQNEQIRALQDFLDNENTDQTIHSLVNKLRMNQSDDGGWPWFPQRQADRYITQHIVAGFGYLQRMNFNFHAQEQELANTAILKAISYLDKKVLNDYLSNGSSQNTDISMMDIHYLYCRSFYTEIPLEDRYKPAYDSLLNQTAQKWQKLHLHGQAMASIVLSRNNRARQSEIILTSLKDRSLYKPDKGRYWAENMAGFRWNESIIETQGRIIEAFQEQNKYNDKQIEEMKYWLLSHKQLNHWKTSKQTLVAAYILLLDKPSFFKIPGKNHLKVTYTAHSDTSPKCIDDIREVNPKIVLPNRNHATIPEQIILNSQHEVPVYGSAIYRTYKDYQEINQFHSGLIVKRQFLIQSGGKWIVRNNPELINTGDRVRIRFFIESDFPMEYIHIQDHRAASFEPVNQISGRNYSSGLSYYKSINDSETNFFIDYLPKGSYMIEYDVYAVQPGLFSGGYATIQCMYNPGYSGQSKGTIIKIVR